MVSPTPLRAGGLGAAAAEFSDGLEALGCSTAFLGPQPNGPFSRATASRPFRRAFGMAVNRRVNARAVRRAVARNGWDLLYAIAGSVPVEREHGVRVIHQSTHLPAVEWAALRSAERETGGRGDFSRGERQRREYEIQRADLIHVTSETVRDEFLEAGIPAERIVHAYLGVDLGRFAPGDKSGDLRVAFVGPLSMRKGVDIVAEVASRLDQEAKVQIVGGPTCPWSRRIAERAPFERLTSVPEMLAAAHVLVLPSRSDAFAYVVLEALASGTVPIVTPEVGAAEIVARLDGRLVVPRADFANAVVELVPELDLSDLSSRATALAQDFDRRRTSVAAAAAVLERSSRLQEPTAKSR